MLINIYDVISAGPRSSDGSEDYPPTWATPLLFTPSWLDFLSLYLGLAGHKLSSLSLNKVAAVSVADLLNKHQFYVRSL